MSEPFLSLEDLTVDLGRRPVLRGLSFSVARGERLAIVGPNGAGKSTLLKCLLRIVPRARGTVRIGGRVLDSISQDALARRLAYVPQAAGGSVPYTVADFLAMSRYPHIGPLAPLGDADRAAVRTALRDTGTEAFEDRLLETLSGGECQKVFLAAALAQEPEALLLDEHGAFLDPAHRVEIQRLLERACRERDLTLLAVTHDLNAATRHFDRILALGEGEIRFDGTPEGFSVPGVLRDVFRHDFVLGAHPADGRPLILAE
jgi:iron complex transport system ATP-binding protein